MVILLYLYINMLNCFAGTEDTDDFDAALGTGNPRISGSHLDLSATLKRIDGKGYKVRQ